VPALAHVAVLPTPTPLTHTATPRHTHVGCQLQAAGALEGGNSEYVNAVYGQLSVTFERLMQPWLWWDPLYWHVIPGGRRSAQQLRVLHDHTMRMIQRRRAALTQGQGASSGSPASRSRDGQLFLDTLLVAKDDTGAGLSDDDIREGGSWWQ
jgi:hypothetical protein